MIKRKIDVHTFRVVDVTDGVEPPYLVQPINADRLIKLDMPSLDIHPDQPRVLEILNEDGDDWSKGTIERFSVDGRAAIRYTENPEVLEWVDLSAQRYRWVL